MKKLFLFIILNSTFLILNSFCFAQNKNIDSLQSLIKIDNEDTSKVKHLYLLAWHYINTGLYDSGLYYNDEALQLAEKLNFKKGVSASYGNIGLFNKEQANYPKALDYYLMGLKIDEELGNNNGIARHLGSIGTVYWAQADYPKALEYYFKALEIVEKLGNQDGIAVKFANIGNTYFMQDDYPKALEYYFKALKIAEALGDENRISSHLSNIGCTYFKQGDDIKGLGYCIKALKIAEKLGNKHQISSLLGNIGSINIELKKYKNAFDNIYQALALSLNLGAKVYVKDHYETLSTLYEKSNIPLLDSIGGKLLNVEQMRLRSIYYSKRSIAIRDVIFSEESKKQLVRKEMLYEFDKKEAASKAEQSKKDALAMADKKKANLILILLSCLLILVFVFTIFIFRSWGLTRKQKGIIEEKNKLVVERNKDITDSIRYAKRIQDALLREEEHISMHLPEHFILFLPKDIVSGDFYWGAEKHGYWYFAVVDCTGHGVPGAVMSMLGISFLNDIVAQELLSPAEILNRLRDKVVKDLRQTGEEGGSKDGMDISFCRLELPSPLDTNQGLKLQWAGANNSLNLIQNGKLALVKADKQPIGYHPNSHPFTNHEIQLQKGDSIYIYSDGYADQFGGSNGKKFKYKQLEDLIVAYNHRPMRDQKELLKKHFIDWKGTLEQVDDVCVFGVRV